MDKGGWSIELAERNLRIPGDSLLFGRDASHSFLRLRNDDGDVVGELHGRAYDPRTQEFGKMLKLTSLFNQGVLGAGNFIQKHFGINTQYARGFFDEYARGREIKLKVEIRGGLGFEPREAETTSTLVYGSREQVKELWARAMAKAVQINHADLEYRPIELSEPAQNCHSVAMDLGEVITGYPITPLHRKEQKFAMPGWSTNLNIDKAFDAAVAMSRALPTLRGVAMEAVPA